MPNLTPDALRKMASISPEASTALEKVIDQMLSVPPSILGFPDENNQSNYYPGDERIAKEEVAAVASVMEKHSIEPENTRVRKITHESPTFEILQASAEPAIEGSRLNGDELGAAIYVKRGDHAAEMSKFC